MDKKTDAKASVLSCEGYYAFLNTVSGAAMTTRVLSATEPVRKALPPTTECFTDDRLAAQDGRAG